MSRTPVIVAAFAAAPRWVFLQWAPLEDEYIITVERNPGWDAPYPVGWLSPIDSPIEFTDQAAKPSTTYRYKVCALYGGDPEALCADDIQVTTPPEQVAPTPDRPVPIIERVASSVRTATIEWTSEHDYHHYNVSWGRHLGDAQDEVDGDRRSFTVQPLQPNSEYHFSVQGCERDLFGAFGEDACSQWSDKASVRTLMVPDGPWHAWYPITDDPANVKASVFSNATPPAVLSRDPNHQDVFVMGNDGRVWTTWWALGENDNRWRHWRPLSQDPANPAVAKFSLKTPPVAVSRDAAHQDVFVIGNDGRVWTTWWAAGDPDWHAWYPITDDIGASVALFARTAPPLVLARDGAHQDVFVFNDQGRVWTSWWAARI